MTRVRSALISGALATLAAVMLGMTAVPARAATSSRLVLSIYRGDTVSPAALVSRVMGSCIKGTSSDLKRAQVEV